MSRASKGASLSDKARFIYDTLVTHATDVYYNHTYAQAVKKSRESGKKTVGEFYGEMVEGISSALKENPENYARFFRDYCTSTRGVVPSFRAMNDDKIADEIAEITIPKDSIAECGPEQRDKVVELMLTRLMVDLGAYILDPANQKRIIDERTQIVAEEVTNQIREMGMAVLSDFRMKVRQGFFAEKTGASEQVGSEVVDDIQRQTRKLKKKYRQAIEENEAMLDELEEANDTIEALKKSLGRAKTTIKKLKRLVELLYPPGGSPAPSKSMISPGHEHGVPRSEAERVPARAKPKRRPVRAREPSSGSEGDSSGSEDDSSRSEDDSTGSEDDSSGSGGDSTGSEERPAGGAGKESTKRHPRRKKVARRRVAGKKAPTVYSDQPEQVGGTLGNMMG